jgi:hypothetical protein
VLNKQHKKAFFKQLAINLVTLFTYNIKVALIHNKKVTMFILNIQKVFNIILKRQLLKRITKQSWSLFLL